MNNKDRHNKSMLAAIILAVGAGLCVFSTAQEQPAPTYQQLYDEVIRLQQQNTALRESTAIAFSQAEREGVEATELREQLEALGVELVKSSENTLQQRLIKAVRDVDIYRQENERQRKALSDLSEGFIAYIAQTSDAPDTAKKAAHQSIEMAGKALTELVDSAQIETSKLEQSKVVSYNDKLSFVILNAGKNSGVRVGTPISVSRDEQSIFTAIITHVHDNLSGALLQENLANVGPPKVGDRIRPVTVRNQF